MSRRIHAFSVPFKKRFPPYSFFSVALFFLWLPYFVLCFPGNVSWDAGTSIMYVLNLETSKSALNNPYFQNWLFGGFAALGRLLGSIRSGIFLYCLLQYVLECIILGKIVFFLRNTWKVKWYFILFLMLLYGFLPVFPIFAVSMGKDSNWGLSLLFFVYYAFQIIDDPVGFFADRRKRICFSLTLIIIALLRNHAVFIALVGPWIFMLLRSNRKTGLYRVLVFPTVGAILVSSVVPAVCGIPSPQNKEDLSFPLQTTAVYVLQYPDDITDEERAAIESVIPADAFQEYSPGFADPLKSRSRFTDGNTAPFLKAWLRLMIRHPSVLLKGLYRAASGYFDPFRLTGIKPHVQLGFYISSAAKEKLQLVDLEPTRLEIVKKLDNRSLNTPVVGLFARIGLYSILLLVSFVLSLRRREFLLCTVPLLLILAGCALSPVNGYYRYSYPYIVVVPFVFTGLLARFGKKSLPASGK